MTPKYLIGIDEAGRGPLAGPVAVGAVCWSQSVPSLALHNLPLRDSKKLTAKQRESWWQWLGEKKKARELNFAVALVSEKVIDQQGIVVAIKLGIQRCLTRLALTPGFCLVKLDGSLKAPALYLNQETIIRGDESEAIISLASIAAKVTRDNFMTKLAARYPAWDFGRHKGYGTAGHYRALARHGLSPVHRLSFLSKLSRGTLAGK